MKYAKNLDVLTNLFQLILFVFVTECLKSENLSSQMFHTLQIYDEGTIVLYITYDKYLPTEKQS